MSITNESSRIRSWFQFATKTSRSDDENTSTSKDSAEWQHQSSHTLLERVTSLRRSLGKSQQRKNKIRPLSAKGLTSAVEQQNIAKSKNSSTSRKASPTATSGGSDASAKCDDDEIYGFTAANLDSTSTRRQLKSSLHAPNVSVYESEANKSGQLRARNEDEINANASAIVNANANTKSANAINACTGTVSLSQDSPEWLKADGEFSFYHQHQHHNMDSRETVGRHYYYQHHYYQEGDMRRTSTQHLSWTEPVSENDDIDRIYENMRGLSIPGAPSQPKQHHSHSSHNSHNSHNSHRNSQTHNNTSDSICNNRKLTKDSGYESASTTISTWGAMNAFSNNYFHSRSDSNASSVSTGGSLSPRTAGNSNSAKSAYHYYEPWSSAKSTSNLPLQVQGSANGSIRRSSITETANVYSDNMITSGKSVLPAKSVPGNLNRESDDNILHKRSHNRNNPTPSSVYSLLAAKSGFDFAPVLKISRKSCGTSFISDNTLLTKYNEHTFLKGSDKYNSQLWKTREKSCLPEDIYLLQDDSPPPTPPVRDSSLASNRKFNLESLNEAQLKSMSESSKATNEAINDCNLSSSGMFYYQNNPHLYQTNYSENRVNSNGGYSKSLVNLRSKFDESDLKQFSQTYPLLPDTDSLQESWSCDQSVTSSCTGVTSLVTSSDYFTASSSAMTHSPSLSSLNTTGTTNTTSSLNYNRNSMSSTSSSQIARSAKVQQPKRQESASILYYEKSKCPNPPNCLPPPPPKLQLHFSDYQQSEDKTSTKSTPNSSSKMIFLDPSKTHKTSDTEIKAIQKRAVYQFYLKQKQQEMQENSRTSPPVDNENASKDAIEIPPRKAQLVVQEIYENSSCVAPPLPPSPPLPPPPLSLSSDIELTDADLPPLPLPPPPTPPPQCEHESANSSINTILTHKVNTAETKLSLNMKQSMQSLPTATITNCSNIVPALASRSPESVLLKSEIATQTTETLRRCGNKAEKGVSQSDEPSVEVTETMYQNDVQTRKLSQSNKSIEDETYAPWAYSKLWPNDKCANTSFDDDSGYACNSNTANITNTTNTSKSGNTCTSPITAAFTFIMNTNSNTGASVCSANDTELLANKYELISRLTTKLDILRTKEMALNSNVDANEALGQEMREKLKLHGINSAELDKINVHCDETEKVTRLLLSISARLQQIDNELKGKSNQKCLSDFTEMSLCFTRPDLMQQSNQLISQSSVSQNNFHQIKETPTAFTGNCKVDETQALVDKREKLLTQLEEALQLRAAINNRSAIIEQKILKKYFIDNNEDLHEFLEFVRLKSKLIVDIREINDRISLGDKYLQTLNML